MIVVRTCAVTFAFTIALMLAKASAQQTGRRAPEAENCGRIEMVRCDVALESATLGTTAPARAGAFICQGDVIRTGPASRSRWLMPNGATVELLPDSTLRLERAAFEGPPPRSGEVRVRLERGRTVASRPPVLGRRTEASLTVAVGISEFAVGEKALVEIMPDGEARATVLRGSGRATTKSGGDASERSAGDQGALKPNARVTRLRKPEIRELEIELAEKPRRKNPLPPFPCEPAPLN